MAAVSASSADVLKIAFGAPDVSSLISGIDDPATVYVIAPLRV
jgi:hypothetical protein